MFRLRILWILFENDTGREYDVKPAEECQQAHMHACMQECTNEWAGET